jgi:hypothetical protein
MSALALTAATAGLVFGRAVQQLNVQGGHYVAAAVTPYVIAAGEVAVIGIVAAHPTIGAVLACGTGGAIGATSAMALHRRFVRKAGNRGQESNA